MNVKQCVGHSEKQSRGRYDYEHIIKTIQNIHKPLYLYTLCITSYVFFISLQPHSDTGLTSHTTLLTSSLLCLPAWTTSEQNIPVSVTDQLSAECKVDKEPQCWSHSSETVSSISSISAVEREQVTEGGAM